MPHPPFFSPPPPSPSPPPRSAAASSVFGNVAKLASATIINPLRFLTGSFDTLPDAVESFFDLPIVSFASQRISDVSVDLTQLQLFGEEVLGVEKVCKPADFRPASRQPAAIEGPTLSITFHSINFSVEDDTSFGLSHLNKTVHINTTFACDKGVITYEKVRSFYCMLGLCTPSTQTPLILRKQFHRAERYRCAECVVRKEFGEEVEVVLFDGGDSQVFESIAEFLNATAAGTVSPFANSLSLRLSSQLQQLLSNPANAALLTNALDLQRRLGALGDSLLESYDNKVNRPLDKLLNATLAAKVWAITGVFDLLK